MPEWTGYQQFRLLIQSVGLGVGLGFLFAFFNVAAKLRRRRRWLLIVCDALFCVIAALITFYFSLAVMDGRLHPLLFGGSLLGFALQHITMGRFLSRVLYRLGRWSVVALSWLARWICLPFRLVNSAFRRALASLCAKREKKVKKTRKKACFFQKKS